MFKRSLGRSGIEVSALGLGCWAIGGPTWRDGRPVGWGQVDDAESIRALHRAFGLGVTFYDTADAYGAGHSERILAQAFAGRRDQVVIATKFGNTYDEPTRRLIGTSTSPEYIRWACEQSLRRLNTDYIDLYQLHTGATPEEADSIADTLDALRAKGKIRAYAWSTDDVDSARLWVSRPGSTAVQHQLNAFSDAPEMLALCTAHNLASINRGPLAMGFLSGKFTADTRLPPDDVRAGGHEWLRYFEDGRPKPEFLDRLDAIRAILTSGGRSVAQGALGWLWARSLKTIPIPGFKSVSQVEDNAGALAFGPLTADQMHEIDRLVGR